MRGPCSRARPLDALPILKQTSRCVLRVRPLLELDPPPLCVLPLLELKIPMCVRSLLEFDSPLRVRPLLELDFPLRARPLLKIDFPVRARPLLQLDFRLQWKAPLPQPQSPYFETEKSVSKKKRYFYKRNMVVFLCARAVWSFNLIFRCFFRSHP
jgi:hypothetical protein